MRHGTTVSVSDSQQRDFHMEKEQVLEEARAITRLNSPHIVEVHDAFLENNTAYIVMEYLEGQSLQERIDTEGPLPPNDVYRIAIAACEALIEVHRQDLLHRDIKPANIMLTRDGRVVLVDFGSARSFNHGQTVRHTRVLSMDNGTLRSPRSIIRYVGNTMVMALGCNGILACGGSSTDKVNLWDSGTGNRIHIHTLPGQDWNGIYSVQFSPDGQRLACGDGYGAVHLWEVGS